jgi:hypothetical protein
VLDLHGMVKVMLHVGITGTADVCSMQSDDAAKRLQMSFSLNAFNLPKTSNACTSKLIYHPLIGSCNYKDGLLGFQAT